MNKNVLIAAGVVLALFLALPLAAKLKQGGGGAASTPAGESAAPADPNQPPYWNASNLPGTAWNAGGYTINLDAGGVASASTPIGLVSGTWTVNGSTLTVSAMGRTINAQISGDQILVEGKPAQRAQ